jgi:hypothetical protein
VNTIKCVKGTRFNLDNLRNDGWSRLLDEVNEFSELHDISRLEMEEPYVDPRQPRKNLSSQTSVTMKWNVLVKLLIGYFKSLTTALIRKTLSCLFAQLRSVQETHFVISMWRVW